MMMMWNEMDIDPGGGWVSHTNTRRVHRKKSYLFVRYVCMRA